MKEGLAKGDIVIHPDHGRGVVLDVKPGGECLVRFARDWQKDIGRGRWVVPDAVEVDNFPCMKL